MSTKIRNAAWEMVEENNPNFDSNGDVWSTLYRYPIWTEVHAGETVSDGWSQKHTAPTYSGIELYTLYQYVQDGTLMGFSWQAMTVKDAKLAGYEVYASSWQRGYISRKTEVMEQPVIIAGGKRNGQLYYMEPSFSSTRYCCRIYIRFGLSR